MRKAEGQLTGVIGRIQPRPQAKRQMWKVDAAKTILVHNSSLNLGSSTSLALTPCAMLSCCTSTNTSVLLHGNDLGVFMEVLERQT